MEVLLLGLIGLVIGAMSRRGSSASASGEGSTGDGDPTRALREYADAYAGEVRARVPVESTLASADAGSAYGDAATLAGLLPVAGGVALDTPETLSELTTLEGLSPVTTESRVSPTLTRMFDPSRGVPPEMREVTVPVTVVDDSAARIATGLRRAAERLYTIATTTLASSRGPYRSEIATLQRTIGLLGDGLIGRATATRIRELTGLRIPGLS